MESFANKKTILIGNAAIGFFTANFFLWGTIAPYVLSYFYHFGGESDKDLT